MGKNKLGAMQVPPLTDNMWRRVVASSKRAEPFDVVRAHYAHNADRIDLTLRNGITIRFPRMCIRELSKARPEDLSQIEIQPGGDGISIRRIDVDISVPGLLANELGGIFARAIGRRGRGRTSPKKAAASRRNGQRGGRPKTAAA